VLKAGLGALLALTVLPPGAMAECRVMNVTFFLAQNDTSSTTGVSTRGSPCTVYFRSSSTSQLNALSIASRANHGVVSELGGMRIRYKPNAGFKGVDRYALRICGRAQAGAGCSTITYNITAQ
jgi:hypothetical protein